MSPTGSPISAASSSSFKLPTMALAMPPPVSPTGFGSLVKKSQLSDLTAVVDQVAQNEEKDGYDGQRRHAGKREHHDVQGLAPDQAKAVS